MSCSRPTIFAAWLLFSQLTAANRDQVSLTPRILTAFEGESVSFTCQCTGTCSGTIIWKFYERNFTKYAPQLGHNELYQRPTQFTDGRAALKLPSTLINQSGVYTCSTGQGAVQSNTAELVVLKERPACNVSDAYGLNITYTRNSKSNHDNTLQSENPNDQDAGITIQCEIEFGRYLYHNVKWKYANGHEMKAASGVLVNGASSNRPTSRLTSQLNAHFSFSKCEGLSSPSPESCSYTVVYRFSQNRSNRAVEEWPTYRHPISREFILRSLGAPQSSGYTFNFHTIVRTSLTAADPNLEANSKRAIIVTQPNDPTTVETYFNITNQHKTSSRPTTSLVSRKEAKSFIYASRLLHSVTELMRKEQEYTKTPLDRLHMILACVAVFTITVLLAVGICFIWLVLRRRRYARRHNEPSAGLPLADNKHGATDLDSSDFHTLPSEYLNTQPSCVTSNASHSGHQIGDSDYTEVVDDRPNVVTENLEGQYEEIDSVTSESAKSYSIARSMKHSHDQWLIYRCEIEQTDPKYSDV